MVSFNGLGENSMVETVVTYNLLADLETVINTSHDGWHDFHLGELGEPLEILSK